ncbi:MAG TPA: quinol:cytochrome C oxidoreductase [Thermoguttaceae bacterium]|nr:quinol:cytochrome C oxidoreductase [Thermoguttaceae bacterium]
MQANPTSNSTDPKETLGSVAPRVCVALAVFGVVMIAAAFGLGKARGDDLRYFLHSYLTGYCYWLSISLGALFFVALQHATRAGWSVTVRRLAEVLAANILVPAILFLPILIPVLQGNGGLYPWADPDIVAGSELLQHKAAYLNSGFFAARAIGYFVVWALLGACFLQRSVRQDESGDPVLTQRMERLGGPALLVLGLTVTFAAFDWLMSLEPNWFSTIFGIYYYAGAAVGFQAVLILAAILLQATGRVSERSITVEHYHDLGKLLFTFVFFWGYIAFSQYMLIWYANIPEETSWYLTRQTGTWKWVSLILLFGHLLIPFVALLSRKVRRSKVLLGFWAVWLLVVHWIDVYWLVMPGVDGQAAPIGLIDGACLLGIGSLYLAGAVRIAGRRSLVVTGDPRLGESLAFENS